MLDRIRARPAGPGLALSTAAVLLATLCSCGSGSAVRAGASPGPSATSASPTTAARSSPSEKPVTPEGAVTPTARSAAKARPAAPRPSTTEHADSPGRHDGSNYDHLSAEGRKAHDTENCAKIPGKKKGSCNELHRKCRASGATAVSSQGERLTCRTSPRDGRLRWLTAGE
ncbi:hypothetical protein [Streptomyces rimosus]|uniref:hypothetical protein n=1 Tax=Streptomyces rimosus TaxID=1927 RepID=UPI00131EBD35|nr:hypothetical protein [Streptomyces rimosus]